jgi:hypothetical protein
MRTITIIALMTALATPLYAQNMPSGMKPKTDQERAQEAKERAAEDKAYRNSLTRIPDREREKKPDPWGNMR